jgi:hypothetical protein
MECAGDGVPIFQGGEAIGELGGGEAAGGVEGAEEIGGGEIALGVVALEAGDDEILRGVVAAAGAGDDVVHGAGMEADAAEAVETAAGLLLEYGFAACAGCGEASGGWASNSDSGGDFAAEDFGGEQGFEVIAETAVAEDADAAFVVQAAEQAADGDRGEKRGAGNGAFGKPDGAFADEACAAEEMKIDDAFGRREGKARHEHVFELGPQPSEVERFGHRGCEGMKSEKPGRRQLLPFPSLFNHYSTSGRVFMQKCARNFRGLKAF